jgi:cyclopropane-fatty-acyl-phospholipid synthase
MARHRPMVENVFSRAGVAIDGTNPWDITVHDERFFARVLREKNLGLGEAYMDGWWDCRRTDEFICLILRSRLDVSLKGELKYLPLLLPGIFFNLQSKARTSLPNATTISTTTCSFHFLTPTTSTAAPTSKAPPT